MTDKPEDEDVKPEDSVEGDDADDADDNAADDAEDSDADDADAAGEDESEESDDEGEGDDADDEGGKAAGSRSSNRIATLSKRANAERERAIRAEAALEAVKNNGGRASGEDAARIRAEKLAIMTPEEKKDFLRDEEMGQLKQSMMLTQLQVIDSTDKATYEAKAQLNPIYAKHQAKVEEALASLRSKGNNASREELLAWVIGKEALKAKPGKKAQKQKDDAAERVNSAKGRSTSARGDISSSGRGGKSLEQRLENIPL